MRQSQLFLKIQKEFPKDETSANARLLIRAGFIDKIMGGVYAFLPLGLRVLKKIEDIIRKEMQLLGAQEVLMPSLHPKANWETTGRWDSFDSLIKFKTFYSETDYALGPTHEEIVVPLMKKIVFSYRDLPTAVFQFQNKFRDEKRVKSGLLRGREFLMKDCYSFHQDEMDLDRYYNDVKKSYFRIFQQTGVSEKTYLTLAAGGTFSPYSDEFQTITEAGEDIIYLCVKCGVALNKEIIDKQKKCFLCGNKNLMPKKAVEVGNIFKLKNNFSRPFGLVYKNQNGEKCDVMMGCYGIGVARLMGAIVELNYDDKGIIWPETVAPFPAHLLSLSASPEVKEAAEKIHQELRREGVEVLYDDREGISAGEKFATADIVGIPYRLVVSEKTLEKNKIEVKKRNQEKTEFLTLKQIVKKVIKQ